MKQVIDDVSVVICAYTEKRWNDLITAVESVKAQTLPAREIIIVIDHNPELLKKARKMLTGTVIVENIEAPGLRGARNSGIAVAQGCIIAFLDDDAVATHDWLKLLVEVYADSRILGTGGAVTPMWTDSKPAWFPEEFYWVVGCSYKGMPRTNSPVRNPIGANMSIRREVFETVGDFHSEIVRIGKQHAGGCEETELCIRAHQYWPQRFFLYIPRASVFHRVPGGRTTWHYFCSRCYVEGLAKAVVSRYVGAKDSLASERGYTLWTLPAGTLKGLADAFVHRDPSGLIRSGVIVVGLIVTALGYLKGRLYLRVAGSELKKKSLESLSVSAQSTPVNVL